MAESIWTLESLKEMLEGKIQTQKDFFLAVLKEKEEAVRRALDSSDRRFEGANETKAMAANLIAQCPTRPEVDAAIKVNSVQIEELRNRTDTTLAELSKSTNRTEGRGIGVKDFIAAIGVLVGVLGLLYAFSVHH